VVDTLEVIAGSLATSQAGPLESIEDESAAYDCSTHPRALAIIAIGTEGADCNVENEKAISKGETRP